MTGGKEPKQIFVVSFLFFFVFVVFFRGHLPQAPYGGRSGGAPPLHAAAAPEWRRGRLASAKRGAAERAEAVFLAVSGGGGANLSVVFWWKEAIALN